MERLNLKYFDYRSWDAEWVFSEGDCSSDRALINSFVEEYGNQIIIYNKRYGAS